jgi:hypothetical protein
MEAQIFKKKLFFASIENLYVHILVYFFPSQSKEFRKNLSSNEKFMKQNKRNIIDNKIYFL